MPVPHKVELWEHESSSGYQSCLTKPQFDSQRQEWNTNDTPTGRSNMLLSSKKVSKSSSFTPRWRQKGSRNGGRHCVIQDPLQYGRKFPRRKVKNGILKCPPKLRRCNRNKLLSVNVTWRSLSNLWRTVWVNPLLGPPLTGDRRPIILDACYRIKKVLETGVQYMLNTGFQIKNVWDPL